MILSNSDIVMALLGVGALMLLGNVLGFDRGRKVGTEEGKEEGYRKGWMDAQRHFKDLKQAKKLWKKFTKEDDDE